MTAVAVKTDFADDLFTKGRISAEDVAYLRREMFRDGLVDRSEAETIFRLDHECTDKDPAWPAFYVDALTDYLVWKAEPRKYVSEENAKFLIDHIVSDDRVDGSTELELLVNVIHWSISCPERLVIFALEAVRDSVLDPDQATYGTGRRPNVIDHVDVEIIRKVIYAGASGGGFTVTRREAELLFELNDATSSAENADTWQDLFVKAVANFLMFPRGGEKVPNADEVRRRDRWLEERRGVGGLLAGVGKSLARLDFVRSLGDLDPFGSDERRAQEELQAARLAEVNARESIDANEARWLIDRIDGDGALHENERALLKFIKENAPQIDTALQAILSRHGM